MLKVVDSEGVVYYDRALIKQIYGNGFHFTNDLLPLYHMLSYFKKYSNLSKSARLRLKWFDYYHQSENASLTCRYFGISRKTFYKWRERYDPNNLFTLEDGDKAPIRRRQREITSEQKLRVIQLRKQYIRYSKIKLAKIYLRKYGEPISSWKVQKVIEQYKLYYNPRKTARTTHKRLNAIKKKRITELKKKPKNGFLVNAGTRSFGTGDYDAWILHLDTAGNVLWQKTYGGSLNDHLYTMEKTTDQYVLIGGTESFGNGDEDGWIVVLDDQGEILWQKTYGGTNDDGFSDIKLDDDGALLAVGSVNRYTVSDVEFANAWLLKLDSNGNTDEPCDLINDSDATVTDTNVVPVDTAVTIETVNISVVSAQPTVTDTNVSTRTVCPQ